LTGRSQHAVIVFGAGIQGCCTALELAKRGTPVTLLERDVLPMNRTSLRNEGKIHLGLVYANEPSMATARLQLEGALSFRRLLATWIGGEADELGLPTPFQYLVARDSLLTPLDLEHHYYALQQHYDELMQQDDDLDYLGTRPQRLFQPLFRQQLERHYDPRRVQAGYATAGLSLTTERLAAALPKAVADHSRIDFAGGREVQSVERGGNGFIVKGHSGEGPWEERPEQLVNAAWDGRPALDSTMGIDGYEGLLHRLKYRVIARLPSELAGAPSVTIVLGPYGDVVMRPNSTVYLSWYPLALRGWSHELGIWKKLKYADCAG